MYTDYRIATSPSDISCRGMVPSPRVVGAPQCARFEMEEGLPAYTYTYYKVRSKGGCQWVDIGT